jgi:putative heme degradation protein
MKNFLKQVIEFFDTIGRARAAAHLARIGQHAAAQRLIAGD